MSDVVMLADEYKEDKHKKKVEGWWISEKYDGVCGLFRQSDKTMWSRNGNPYTLPDFITKQLVATGIDLHGEIWFGHNTFDLCSGAARRDVNDDEIWKTMTFMVFETPNLKLPFEERIKLIAKSIKDQPNIKGVKYRKFKPNETSIAEELKKVEEAGGEGLILRKPKSMYVIKRSKDMLKVKSWIFKEATVIGYNEGGGKYKGMVGSLKIKSDEFGEQKVGTGLNDWQRTSLNNEERKRVKAEFKPTDGYNAIVKIIQEYKGSTEHKKRKKWIDAMRDLNAIYTSMPVIGDVITYRFKETTKDGNPKFPSFIGVRDYE